jgi:hypothetical protein
MPLKAAIGLLLSTAAAASPPQADPTSPSDQSAIIVEGATQRGEQIRQFVKDLTPAAIHGQLGRFEEPVCPAVLGLSDRQNREIADRMRAVAQAAEIPTGKAGCQPNALLIVTSDKSQLIRRLAEDQPGMFPVGWAGSDFRRLEADLALVAAWHMEMIADPDGRPIAQAAIRGNKPGDLVKQVRMQRTTAPASRLTPLSHPVFWGSVIVVQTDALAGLTPTQLADYAAMRSLVRTDPERVHPSAADSILSVIGAPMGTAVPITLTEWDLTFLKSFYASSKNMYAEYQRAEMKHAMKRDLDRQQAEQH